MLIKVKNKETLEISEFSFKCCLGLNGKTNSKSEGDKKTPVGKFNLGPLFYRPDREKKPKTKLTCIKITKNMNWCNDSTSKKYYNRLISKNKKIKYEKLYRRDYKYNLMIPVSYNSNPVRLGKGSAIFLHLTKNYKPTAGCIALNKKDFIIMLKLIDKKTKIKIF
tara:strand:- start:117 stop:611 length:495 start_codon:yes stop_codon:yes gene_type:complete